MRLTIGGTLIFLGIGAVAGYMVADKAYLDLAKNKIRGVTDQAGSLVGLFKFGESDKKPEVYSPPPPFPAGTSEQSVGAGSVSVSSGVPQAVGGLNPSTAESSLPAVASPELAPTRLVQEKPSPKTSKKSKRARTAKKSASKPKSSVVKSKTPARKTTAKAGSKPAASQDRAARLIGTYVSVELITGRSVQGILEAKTATHYTLNVPGLGPLEYPIENVKGILPAQ